MNLLFQSLPFPEPSIMWSIIIAEIGDFNRFDSTNKILAYAGISPFTYQSRLLGNCYSHMENCSFHYLRYIIYNATKYIWHWDKSFVTYLSKKRYEGKHNSIALSHATKKPVRIIFAIENQGKHATMLLNSFL